MATAFRGLPRVKLSNSAEFPSARSFLLADALINFDERLVASGFFSDAFL